MRRQRAICRPPPGVMLPESLLPTRRRCHRCLEAVRHRCLQRRQGGRRPKLRRAGGELAQEVGPARRRLQGQGRQARVEGMDRLHRQEEKGAEGQRVKVGMLERRLARAQGCHIGCHTERQARRHRHRRHQHPNRAQGRSRSRLSKRMLHEGLPSVEPRRERIRQDLGLKGGRLTGQVRHRQAPHAVRQACDRALRQQLQPAAPGADGDIL